MGYWEQCAARARNYIARHEYALTKAYDPYWIERHKTQIRVWTAILVNAQERGRL